MIELSIVIPTHNRSEILDISLKKIFESNFPQNKFEVIIVDDASTDTTEKICSKWAKKNNLKYIYQKKHGQGVARNTGIKNANGKIIIFGQDDIFVTKNFIQEHYNFHQKNPQENYACLGLILWDPNININPLMKWNTNETTLYGKFGGHQFAFNQLTHNKAANYNYFYTSNLSLKKSILTENMFDPWFDGYGWEDMELGYRLEKNLNLTLIYNSNALVYHHHEINLNEFKNRMISIGQSIHLLHAKHPEISNKLSKFKLNAYKIISQKYFILTLSGINKVFKNKLIPLYFYCLSKKYFLIGYKNIPSKLKINEN